MRPVAGEAALEIAVGRARPARRPAPRRPAPSSAAGTRSSASPSSPSAAGVRGEARRAAASTASARSRISAIAVARELGVPGRQRAAAGAARRGSRRSARCAGPSAARVGAARAGACRPQRGDDLVEVRAAQRRRARARARAGRAGRPTTSGRADDVGQALDRRAVDAQALRPRRAGSRRVISWRAVASSLGLELQPGQRRAEAHAPRARWPSGTSGPVQREVERLEQVRLAGAVAARRRR